MTTRLRFAQRLALALTAIVCIASPTQASPLACVKLTVAFKPSDVSLAYKFLSHHGECIAHFADETFDGVAGVLTLAVSSGVIPSGKCTAALNDPTSQTAQSIINLAGGDAAVEYLSCACAVADSGVADRIREIVGQIKECAAAFDPTKPLGAAFNEAGNDLGMSTLWGLETNNPDSRAGIGNGGAPTVSTTVQPYCAPPNPFYLGRLGAQGYYFKTCACGSPTRAFAEGHFEPGTMPENTDWGFSTPTFQCLACAPGTALVGGFCSTCNPVTTCSQGHCSIATYGPNASGTACIPTGGGGSVSDPCHAWEKWGGGTECTRYCGAGQTWAGGQCHICPDDTQEFNNVCTACPAGTHSKAGAMCVGGFPSLGCPAGYVADATQTKCVPIVPLAPAAPNIHAKQPGLGSGAPQPIVLCNTHQVKDPRSGRCVACPAGQVSNPSHRFCVPTPVTTTTPR